MAHTGCSCKESKPKHNGLEHEHEESNPFAFKSYIPAIISFTFLIIALVLDHFTVSFFEGYFRLIWYIVAYVPVAYPVLKEAAEGFTQKDFFTEFTLMGIATLGAFAIGEYPEGVAVMLFYTIGELFQSAAVDKAKGNIKALLDIRPDSAVVLRNSTYTKVTPENVNIGEQIQVKVGEKVPLDSKMITDASSFNTSALTGESKPRTIRKDETVLAGMVNLEKVIELQVEKEYSDSSLAKILEMVQNATSRKAKTELLIRKFARIYTPIVFLLAVLITVLPILIVNNYIFNDWLYRALVFLVISCPCALVISIPLGYFGGIGAASRYGILFKGANYLDLMSKVNTVVMDKTGTLTQGVFKVQTINAKLSDEATFLNLVASVESYSNHPIAKAILSHKKADTVLQKASSVEEIPGLGLMAIIESKTVLVGNTKLLKKFGISYDNEVDTIIDTIVVVAINNQYAGYITIADQIKDDSTLAISEMHRLGIQKTVMLSGDKDSITQKIASSIGIDVAYGDLLPEDKVKHLEEFKTDASNVVAFVGDGINDAPALALSDIGIAMGGMGSDAAIEVADVVIQTDQPSKIATAISIAKSTRQIVYQNITLAVVVKLLVLVLGGFGVANMWEAVFADVGVSLLAILNAIRIMKKKF